MNLFLNLLDFLYPRRCPICDEPVKKADGTSCSCCKNLIPILSPPFCFKCGRPLNKEEYKFCSACLKHDLSFDRGFALWNYNHPAIKKSLRYFKYKGRKEYADFYAEKLLEVFPFLLSPKQISALIPVPIHKKRYQKRGYNQAAVLAEKLSSLSGIPVIEDLLIRNKNTLPQNQLTFKDRRKNLHDAFTINTSSPHYQSLLQTVILIDDIYTTGSTADTCSYLLKEAGVVTVYVLCLSSS